MCGRYTDSKRNKAMLASVGFQADFAFTPRYNIAPTQEASIVDLGRMERPSTDALAGR
jgi:putative SOS response-associated peptidase YedK